MELTHLQTFVVVAEENSITQAARRLFTTTSSISVQIKALEDELGVQLFVRTARGMQITDKGEALLQKARHTLQTVRDLVNHASELQTNLIGKVTLGLNASLNYLRIPALIQSLHGEAPGISLHFQQRCSGRGLEDVIKGKLDLAFVFGTAEDNRVTSTPLHQAELCIAAPAAWHLTSAGWEELSRHPWVCNTSDCPFEEIIQQEFTQRDLAYRSRVTTEDEMSKAELVAAGVGLSLLEASEAQIFAHTGKVEIVESISFSCPLSVVSLTYRRHEPLLEIVLSIIKDGWCH